MRNILTPKEVHDVESFTLSMLNSGQWPLEGEYIPEGCYARLEASHEALREQLAEAQAAVRMLMEQAQVHHERCGSECPLDDFAYIPAVQRALAVMEETP